MNFFGNLIILAIETVIMVQGRTFTWLLSTSYNSTENWSKGRLPCSTDIVVFPKEMRLTIELPEGQLKMKEILLPRNGELVFPKHGSISISSRNKIDGSCEGGTNAWVRDEPGKWLSPASWTGPSPACPDLERVPCPTDDVIFPPGSTYSVILPPFTVAVSSVTIKGNRLSGDAWEKFLWSTEGERQFGGGSVLSSGVSCSEPAGCECPADLLNRWVCPNVICDVPACISPVRPLGDCCLKCGAFLLYNFSPVTKISQVEKIVKQELSIEEDVYWHVGRTMGFIQVVLVEKSYSGVTEDLAKRLDHRLLTSFLGLKKSKLEASGPAAYPGSPGMPILLFFLSMLVAVAFFTCFIFYYERGMSSVLDKFSTSAEGRFAFARFENQSGVVELGEAAAPIIEDENPTREFANPMFSEVEGVIARRKVLAKDNTEVSSSDETSLSDSEKEMIIVPDENEMEEISTVQLLD